MLGRTTYTLEEINSARFAVAEQLTAYATLTGELTGDTAMNNNAVLRGNTVVAYRPETSVVKLELGDDIRLTTTEFEALSAAFFTELEARFLPEATDA